MRLQFLTARRAPPVPSPVLVEVFDLLRRRGFTVDAGIAEEMLVRPDALHADHDLYVLKSHTELSLSLAGVLDGAGARLLNPYASCVATQNKIVASRRLRAAGVPIPRGWVTGRPELLRGALESGALILKPYLGHRGAGIAIVRTAAELAAVPPPAQPMLVQEYVEGSGEDLKLYVVGDAVFAVRKPFSPTSFSVPGRPCEVGADLHDIALRCGRALGLGLYGLDVLETERGPVVVDVNYFPGYKGVPEVAGPIADYIEGYAVGRRELAPPGAPARRPAPERPRAAAGPRPLTTAPRRSRRPDPVLLAIVAEGFLSRLSFGLVTFALPLYAFRELGMSIGTIGVLLSFNLIVGIALKPAMGVVADRVGLKPTLTAALWLRSAVAALLALATVPWQLFAVRGVHGVSIAMRDPAVNALIAEHGGKRAIATAFAWYQTAKSVAGAAGKLVAGVLLTLTASNFSIIFLVASVLSAVPLLLVARFVTGAAPVPAAAAPEGLASAADPAPRIVPFMGLGFLISGTAYMLTNLFPIFAVEYAGLTEAQTGAIYAISAAVTMTGPGFGWLSDNVSRRLVLSIRSVANVVSSLLYLLFPSFAGVAAGRVFDDMGKAAFRPAWGALMAHVSGYDRRRRARTMGYLTVGEDAGEIAGPIAAGLLWSAFGVGVLLGVRIALAVVTEIYSIVLGRSLGRLDEPRAPPAPPARLDDADGRAAAPVGLDEPDGNGRPRPRPGSRAASSPPPSRRA